MFSIIRMGASELVKDVSLNMDSPLLTDGEEIVWSAAKYKGFFRKRKVWEAVVTNYRIFEYDWENKRMIVCCLLEDAEPVVERTWRVRRSTWGGPVVYRRGFGVYGGYGQSRYVTVGILSIVANGRVVTRWEIEDPRGLQRLIKTVKKQMKEKAKAESGRNR